jgi:DNA invertase Pin-like site-specific DNA recombinase
MVKITIKKQSSNKRAEPPANSEDDILSKLSSLKMSAGKNAIIYSRESDVMKHSLEDQVQKGKEYAKKHGFKVGSVINETCSGEIILKQTQLMEAILENKDTHFIFSHTDRITRDFQGFCSHFIHCCNVNRNTIHIVNEGLVSSIPFDFKKIVCGIIDAEEERKTISRRIKSSIDFRKRNGIYKPSIAKYGRMYVRNNEGKVWKEVQCEQEMDTIRLVNLMYFGGTCDDIEKFLKKITKNPKHQLYDMNNESEEIREVKRGNFSSQSIAEFLNYIKLYKRNREWSGTSVLSCLSN